MNIKYTLICALSAAGLALSACSNIETEAKYPTGYDRNITGGDNIYGKPDSVFGEEGLKILKSRKDDDGDTGIGVNKHLWRAALDTVSFMPLASVDPFGGVIITDWYDPEDGKNERFKLNVLILDKKLRADGVQVRVFKQIKKGGKWRDSAAGEAMGRDLEDTILTRARQLRVAELDD